MVDSGFYTSEIAAAPLDHGDLKSTATIGRRRDGLVLAQAGGEFPAQAQVTAWDTGRTLRESGRGLFLALGRLDCLRPLHEECTLRFSAISRNSFDLNLNVLN